MRKSDSSGFVLIIALLVGFTLFSACADLVQIAVQGMRDTRREAILLQERAELISLSGKAATEFDAPVQQHGYPTRVAAPNTIFDIEIEHSTFDISGQGLALPGGRHRKMSNGEYSMSNFQGGGRSLAMIASRHERTSSDTSNFETQSLGRRWHRLWRHRCSSDPCRRVSSRVHDARRGEAR